LDFAPESLLQRENFANQFTKCGGNLQLHFKFPILILKKLLILEVLK